jgi:type III secretion protein Q
MPSPQVLIAESIVAALPQVGAAEAAASRVIFDKRFIRSVQRRRPAVRVAPLARAPRGPLQCLKLDWAGDGAEVLLHLDGRAGAQMVADPRSPPLPAGLREFAAQALFGRALASLEALGLDGLHASDLRNLDTAQEPVPRGGWNLLCDGDGEIAAFALRGVSHATQRGLRERVRALRADASLRTLLAWRGAVALAERPVRRGLLRSLQVGDVLLLTTPSTDTEGTEAWVRWPGALGRCWRAPARVEERSLMLKGEPHMHVDAAEMNLSEDAGEPLAALQAERDETAEATGMTETGEETDEHTAEHTAEEHDDDADAMNETVDTLDTLEIPVRFEIETLPVPLADLESMAAGYVIELATPLAAASVRLVACGRVVGHADLVAVGDRLGARITRMAARDAK